MNLKPNFSESAIVTKHKLLFQFMGWRLYSATCITRTVKLLVDHEIRERYSNLHRLNDDFFIGQEKYER